MMCEACNDTGLEFAGTVTTRHITGRPCQKCAAVDQRTSNTVTIARTELAALRAVAEAIRGYLRHRDDPALNEQEEIGEVRGALDSLDAVTKAGG